MNIFCQVVGNESWKDEIDAGQVHTMVVHAAPRDNLGAMAGMMYAYAYVYACVCLCLRVQWQIWCRCMHVCWRGYMLLLLGVLVMWRTPLHGGFSFFHHLQSLFVVHAG
jgi:hypothetical protein